MRIRSFLKLSKILLPLILKVLYPIHLIFCRLYLDIFRRKPAIPEFD